MIIMDPPREDTFRGRTIRTAHLVSTLPGAEGTAELLTFARALGVKEGWIQHRGTPHEHFDLMGSRCDAAQAAGAVVDRRLLGRTLIEKSEALQAAITRGLHPHGHCPPDCCCGRPELPTCRGYTRARRKT